MGNLLCDYRASIGLFKGYFYCESPFRSLVANCGTIAVGLFFANPNFVMYILLLLLLQSWDIELNPGPVFNFDTFTIMHAYVRSLSSGKKLTDLNMRAFENKNVEVAVTETWLYATIQDLEI
jgi:hypothetical protein